MLRCLAFLLICIGSSAMASADRIALVIGMGAYRTVAPLDNTINDAVGISDTLSGVGFEVTTVLNATGQELKDALNTFAFEAETSDLALIYFAGHGVEVQGENFLMPIDVAATSNRDVQRQGVSLKQLLNVVEGARKMRIVILDSCRDNPFGDLLDAEALRQAAQQDGSVEEGNRGFGAVGLAPVDPDRGTLVAYAARDGQRALDSAGGDNSPYATALMETLPNAGLEISLMFRQIRDKVLNSTANRQEPHTYGSLTGTPFYLAGNREGAPSIEVEDRRIAWASILPDQAEQLQELASQGDTRSMVGLAYIRLNSADQRFSPSEAAKLLEQAANQGSAEAQFELARLFEKGLGVEQNVDRALDLYKAAALQEFPDALNDLGFMYFQGGMGLPRDQERALKYFEHAADLGHPQAMFNFAALIDDGMIEEKGPEDAAYYLYRALRAGSEDVYNLLSERPNMFLPDTRKELQKVLRSFNLYQGSIDGHFGQGTKTAIRKAFGLI